jgi:transposase
MPRLVPTERTEIVTQVLKGRLSQRDAARKANVSRQTISLWVSRRRRGDRKLEDNKRSGRRKVLDHNDKAYLRTLPDQKLTLAEMADRVGKVRGKEVSVSTVRRVITSGRAPRRYLAITPVYTISRRNMTKRYIFCSERVAQDKQAWICCDAVLLRYDYQSGRTVRMAWQRPTQRMKTYKPQHSSYLLCYGAVASSSYSPLIIAAKSHKRCIVPSSETFQAAFLQLLAWSKSLPRRRGGYSWILDNATCHTSTSSQQFLKDHKVDLIAPWPAQSADLNLVENCWSALQASLAKKSAKSFESWQQAVLASWNGLPKQHLVNLWGSWQGRFEKVIDRVGGGPVA